MVQYDHGLFITIRIPTRKLKSTQTCDATGVFLVRDGNTRVGVSGQR